MAEHSLVEIPVANLSTLRDKFLVDWPAHILAFSFISNLISKCAKYPEITPNIFSLDNKWETDGTFVAFFVRAILIPFSSLHSMQFFSFNFKGDRKCLFASLDSKFENLKLALKLLDYSEMVFFMAVRDVYRPVIDEVISDLKLHIHCYDGTVMKYYTKEDAKNFSIE